MKRHDRLKTIQLVVYILLAAACVYLVPMNKTVYHQIAQDPNMRLVCVLLWILFGVSFLFMLLDFTYSSRWKKDYRELDYAVHSDPLSGLGNRLGADALIENYLDKPVPPDFACIMFDLSNIREVNEMFGHSAGNNLIKSFSEVLNTAGAGTCYVARNGGNKFIAIFEETNETELKNFLMSVHEEVRRHNEKPGAMRIRYRMGGAFHEPGVKSVPDLIGLANRRIYEKVDVSGG